MSAILEDLQRIKQLREDSAETAVRRQNALVQQAAEKLKQAQQTLTEYQNWRPQREQALFAEIQHQAVKLKQIDDYQAALGLLRERENQLQDQLSDAQKNLQSAQQALRQAQQQHMQARKASAKFAEFVARWRSEEKRKQDYKEDLEMEEFSGQAHSVSNVEEDHYYD